MEACQRERVRTNKGLSSEWAHLTDRRWAVGRLREGEPRQRKEEMKLTRGGGATPLGIW